MFISFSFIIYKIDNTTAQLSSRIDAANQGIIILLITTAILFLNSSFVTWFNFLIWTGFNVSLTNLSGQVQANLTSLSNSISGKFITVISSVLCKLFEFQNVIDVALNANVTANKNATTVDVLRLDGLIAGVRTNVTGIWWPTKFVSIFGIWPYTNVSN